MKEKSYTISKEFVLKYETIPIINCFELSTMLAGKWISKMFVTNTTNVKVARPSEQERYSYEFTCDLYYEEFEKIINTYFRQLCKVISFVNQGGGKV
jgi:hypothetical protein